MILRCVLYRFTRLLREWSLGTQNTGEKRVFDVDFAWIRVIFDRFFDYYAKEFRVY